tara:strand:- start:265 stop:1302 length:1038 start_codon:yes stop_codon:yes gene_type:complete
MSGTVGKPKIYIDYISYFKATGLGVSTDYNNTNINEDYSDLLTYNPSNGKTFTPVQEGNTTDSDGVSVTKMLFKVGLGDGTGEPRKLVASINWAGVLNHNFEDMDRDWFSVNGMNIGGGSIGLNASAVYGAGKNNTRLWALNADNFTDYYSGGLSFIVQFFSFQQPLRIGALVAGRTFSFPHNANLSMNIDYNADGIKKRRTLGGRDIVDINYYKQPDWNGQPPFVETPTGAGNLSTTHHIGRRSWALTFSFLTANDTFPQSMDHDFMFDNAYTDGEEISWTNWGTENITSHFMTLTMNGQLPFIFQPDDTKDTYAMCRLRSNSFSVQQSAPNLYTCKMTFDETW